jgi:hypothetical protein
VLTEADLPSAEVALEICSVGPWDFEREGQLREVCQQLQLDETHLEELAEEGRWAGKMTGALLPDQVLRVTA